MKRNKKELKEKSLRRQVKYLNSMIEYYNSLYDTIEYDTLSNVKTIDLNLVPYIAHEDILIIAKFTLYDYSQVPSYDINRLQKYLVSFYNDMEKASNFIDKYFTFKDSEFGVIVIPKFNKNWIVQVKTLKRTSSNVYSYKHCIQQYKSELGKLYDTGRIKRYNCRCDRCMRLKIYQRHTYKSTSFEHFVSIAKEQTEYNKYNFHYKDDENEQNI